MEDQVRDYVYNTYKMYKDKILIITEFKSHYSVKVQKDESPLILSKAVV